MQTEGKYDIIEIGGKPPVHYYQTFCFSSTPRKKQVCCFFIYRKGRKE